MAANEDKLFLVAYTEGEKVVTSFCGFLEQLQQAYIQESSLSTSASKRAQKSELKTAEVIRTHLCRIVPYSTTELSRLVGNVPSTEVSMTFPGRLFHNLTHLR